MIRVPAHIRDMIKAETKLWESAYATGKTKDSPEFDNSGKIPLWRTIERLAKFKQDHRKRSRKSAKKNVPKA